MATLIDDAPAPLAQALSTWRAIDPPGALLHVAHVLDASTGATEFEAEIDVELLAIDATGYRAIRDRTGGDPARMAATIREIVAERGKLQNPWTGSGGVLMGRVTRVGHAHGMSELRAGERVMPLASLIAVPLRLSSVGPVDPANPHVPVSGRAIVTGRMLCVRVPEDLPKAVALSAFDVYPAASHIRELATDGMHVVVLGSGHAGLLALAAAREATGDQGLITAIDRSPDALDRARAVDPSATLIAADVTDTIETVEALSERTPRPADLTLLCTTVPGGEGTAILTTADSGTILFFSTATSFAAAALGADAVGSQARLVIPNGFTDDRGEYAFDLLRRLPALREAFEAAS
jgi:L-erythro-3,5-diaminohexanoate dehydrogenase